MRLLFLQPQFIIISFAVVPKQSLLHSDFMERYIFMRLDKYLKVSRIIKRRSVANEVCDAGHVSVNGKTARASYDVKAGDILEIQIGEKIIKAKVLLVTEYADKSNADSLYEIIE